MLTFAQYDDPSHSSFMLTFAHYDDPSRSIGLDMNCTTRIRTGFMVTRGPPDWGGTTHPPP